LLVKSY